MRRRLGQGDFNLFAQAQARLAEGRAGGRRLVLKFVDLSGLDLTDLTARLVGADLSGVVGRKRRRSGQPGDVRRRGPNPTAVTERSSDPWRRRCA